jgi:hypothetical protein
MAHDAERKRQEQAARTFYVPVVAALSVTALLGTFLFLKRRRRGAKQDAGAAGQIGRSEP